jgi:HEAT repeat protein
MTTRRPFALLLTALALVTWIVPVPAFAERIGSPYRGPLESVGAGGQETDQPSGGGDDGGSGGGDGGGQDEGAPPPPTGGPGGAPAGGAGGKEAKLDGKVTWQWWWEYSKEPYLARSSERGRVNMGSSYYWFGGGAKFPPRDIVPPSEKQKAGAAFAQLVKMLHGDSSAGVRAEVATALGRIGVVACTAEQKKEGQSDNLVVRELIHAAEKDTSPDVRISALLGLGMTRDKDAGAYLLRTFEKQTADDKPWALVALGLSGNIEAVKVLVDQLPKSGKVKDPAGIAAVHALGLLGPDAVAEIEKAGGIAKLAKLADERGFDPLQTQLVRTLGLLQVSRKKVSDMVDSPSPDIQWMALLSLANYTRDEKEAEAAFKTLEGKGGFGSGDNQNKSFAVIAMGRLAGGLDPNSKLRDKILKFVRKEALEQRANNYTRSCAALAFGLANERSAIPPIAALLTDTTAQDHVVSAACIGLGLLKATDHADSIRDNVLLKKSWDDDTRGYAALGIALMGDTTRIGELKHFAGDKALNDKTKRQLPLALGLLGDKGDVRTLVNFFAKNWKKNERFEVSNAAFGLSWLKDQSAVEQLVTLAQKSPDADARGMAAIALGYVGAQDRVSPLSRCYENASHRNGFGGWKLLLEISLIL